MFTELKIERINRGPYYFTLLKALIPATRLEIEYEKRKASDISKN